MCLADSCLKDAPTCCSCLGGGCGRRFRLGGLKAHFEFGFQPPKIALQEGLQSNLKFSSAGALGDPHYAELGFVLPILQCQETAQLQIRVHRAEAHACIGNVQGVDQICIGVVVDIDRRDPHWQNCPLPVAAALRLRRIGSVPWTARPITFSPISHDALWGNHASILLAVKVRANSLMGGQSPSEVVGQVVTLPVTYVFRNANRSGATDCPEWGL